MAGRLFTFGCSFTKYYWPTWADLLLTQTEGENWGMSGGGNKFIFESLIECDVKNKIAKDDTVIIMWTSFFREDRYMHGHWQNYGNVYNAEPMYDKQFLQKYWDDFGAVLHNLNYIYATTKILKGIGCQWKMSSMLPLAKFNEYATDISQIDAKFNNHLELIHSNAANWIQHDLYTFNDHNSHNIPPISWKGRMANDKQINIPNFVDPHPTPLTHWMWAKTYLTEFVTNPNLVDIIAIECQNKLQKISQHDDGYVHDNIAKKFSICKSISRI
jgi:hypothetical protein